MRARAAAVLTAAAAALLALPGAAGALQTSFVGDFSQPTYVTAPPGDAHRLFVVEKQGVIEVLHDGVRRQFLALDPTELLSDGEQGLLSMAFAPDYATSGRFYVYYTTPQPPNGNFGNLVEYRRSASDPDSADPASRRLLFTVDHPDHMNHNGGQLQFGPDGLLYLSTGDGGGGNDPGGNAQNTASRLGKLLRIDPRKADAVPEVYAFGLRNPWRFSFDRLTGDLTIGDVGESHREEVDFTPKGTAAGADYGWHCIEGTLPNADIPPCTPAAPYVAPVFEYTHDKDAEGRPRCSITGGYVVRTHDLEALYGRYVYADYCAGDVRSVALSPTGATGDAPTGVEQTNIYTFGEDSCGHVYFGTGIGKVYELMADGVEAPTPCPDPKPPGKPPPPKDVRPPHVKVARAFRQSLATFRSLFLRVRCDEHCGATASARLTIRGFAPRLRVRALTRTLAAGKSVRFRLLLTPRQAKLARAALRDGLRVRGTLRVAARDTAGNATVKTKPVLVLP